MVAVIILVVAFAVQQFHVQGNVQRFCERKNFFETTRAILNAFFIGNAASVPGHDNHVLQPGSCHLRHEFFRPLDKFFVVLERVPTVGNAAGTVRHTARQAILLHYAPIVWTKQVYARNSHGLRFPGQFIQFYAAETPAAYALFQPALAWSGWIRLCFSLGSPQDKT